MQVPAFLIKVQLRLIAHEQLMAAIADVDCGGIDLIAVAHPNASYVAAYLYGHRVGRTIRQTSVHYPFLVGVEEPS